MSETVAAPRTRTTAISAITATRWEVAGDWPGGLPDDDGIAGPALLEALAVSVAIDIWIPFVFHEFLLSRQMILGTGLSLPQNKTRVCSAVLPTRARSITN